MKKELTISPAYYGNVLSYCDRCQQEKKHGTIAREFQGYDLDQLDPKLILSMIAQAISHERTHDGHEVRVIEFRRGV